MTRAEEQPTDLALRLACKRARADMRAATMNRLDEAVLREALVHAEAAVTVFDANRRFLAVNDRYLEITGYSREEVDAHQAGSTLRLPALEQDEFIELITAKTSVGEADILSKNGEPMAVEYVVIPTSIGGVRHYIGMMWPLVHAAPLDEEALSKKRGRAG